MVLPSDFTAVCHDSKTNMPATVFWVATESEEPNYAIFSIFLQINIYYASIFLMALLTVRNGNS
jgi:hypothetical protein